MSNKRKFDPAYLALQKRRLTTLRNELLAVRQGQQNEQRSVNSELIDQPHDYEDDAQRLAAVDLQGNLQAVDDERLSNIQRALQKIEDGTYGLSDASGEPISVERLNAAPEALYTEEEQRRRESESSRSLR